MLVTSHVLAGAGIGAVMRRPLAAFALGAASHFAMDAVPHWGPGDDHTYFMRVAVRDGLAGLAALGAVAALSPRRLRWAVLAGAIGAATPDLDKPFAELTGRDLWPRPVRTFHSAIQRESPHAMPRELAVLAGIGAVTVAMLRRPS